ncbi:hypothetical protein SAMN04489806_2539 [Paramicrobacterium humi]|uniref:Uncharacterized protein n=1 Tax=Paramicrobacterium humi TaxID=640635 RepID=A0A1H4PKL2_9MICO|nr:DUF6804 family protein [Microbacterium humi]SEC07976.1 hypothetical protein SAMN04489806_2539 [Microbacterium humi]
MARPASRYAEPEFSRPALAPGLLAAIVLMATVALFGSDWFLYVRFAVCILVAVMAVFVIQARRYAWLVVLVPVIVAWNPVWPFPIGGTGWFVAQLLVPIALVAVGVLVKVPRTEGRQAR